MLMAERHESERLRQIIQELQRHRFGRVGCRPESGWNSLWRILRSHEGIVSGGKVNRLFNGLCGDGGWQNSLRLDPALEFLRNRSIALVVRTLRHWLGGGRVNVKGDRRLPGCRQRRDASISTCG